MQTFDRTIRRHLFHDIKNRGYTGSRSNLERLLKVWREAENIQPDDPPPDEYFSKPVRDPDTDHVISSVVAAALCLERFVENRIRAIPLAANS